MAMINRRNFEQLLERNKLARIIFAGLCSIIGVLFVIALFSWDSFIPWLITKEKSDLNLFIFWAIFAIVVLIVSIVLAIVLGRKRK